MAELLLQEMESLPKDDKPDERVRKQIFGILNEGFGAGLPLQERIKLILLAQARETAEIPSFPEDLEDSLIWFTKSSYYNRTHFLKLKDPKQIAR